MATTSAISSLAHDPAEGQLDVKRTRSGIRVDYPRHAVSKLTVVVVALPISRGGDN